MIIDDAIAACGTSHQNDGTGKCAVIHETGTQRRLENHPCREAFRAAAEYALRDAEAWRRVAILATDGWHYVDPEGIKLDDFKYCLENADSWEDWAHSSAIATEAHRLVLAQMEEERKHA